MLQVEMDFLVAEEGYAVQASYSIYSEGMQDTFKRETKALKQLVAFLSLKCMMIVTYDEEVPLDNSKLIEVIPVWKCLFEWWKSQNRKETIRESLLKDSRTVLYLCVLCLTQNIIDHPLDWYTTAIPIQMYDFS